MYYRQQGIWPFQPATLAFKGEGVAVLIRVGASSLGAGFYAFCQWHSTFHHRQPMGAPAEAGGNSWSRGVYTVYMSSQ